MRLPESKLPVDPRLAALIEGMDEQSIVLLTLKILNPDRTLADLAKEVWPDVGYASRNRNVHKARTSKVIEFISRHPYQLAVLLNSKLMPLAIATLYECLSAKKENVRATAAKEIIRLAQTTVHRISTDEEEEFGAPALDALLTEPEEEEAPAEEGEFHAVDEGQNDEGGGDSGTKGQNDDVSVK